MLLVAETCSATSVNKAVFRTLEKISRKLGPDLFRGLPFTYWECSVKMLGKCQEQHLLTFAFSHTAPTKKSMTCLKAAQLMNASYLAKTQTIQYMVKCGLRPSFEDIPLYYPRPVCVKPAAVLNNWLGTTEKTFKIDS